MLFKNFHGFFLSSKWNICSFSCHPRPHLPCSLARVGCSLLHYAFCSACFCDSVYLFSAPKMRPPTASSPNLYQPFRVCLPGSTKPYVPSSTNCDLFFTLIPTTLGLGHSCDTQLTLSCTISLLNGKHKEWHVIFILASWLFLWRLAHSKAH